MNSEEQLDRIEQYLEGNLTGDELKAFEQKMATDPVFAAEVNLQKEIAEAMREDDVMALSQKIRSIQHQKKGQSGGSGRNFIFRRLLQIAAGIALLIAVYFVYENFNQTSSPQELAAQYFSPDEQISHTWTDTERSSDPDSSVQVSNEVSNEIDAIWRAIDNLYSQKNYSQAIEKLSEIKNLDPAFEVQSPDEFYYYQGLFLMLNDNPSSAIKAFQKIKNTYTEKASWYVVICYLKLGDVNSAKQHLAKFLSNGDNPLKDSAEDLMKNIEKIN